MNLTAHFTLEELTFSSTAERLSIDNSPDPGVVAHLTALATGLELVRTLLGNPMHIDSGYRCPALNQAVGGARNSAHMDGFAADFICPAFGSPEQIVEAIVASSIRFDQLIVECNSWVHISFDPAMRRSILTAHAGQNGMVYSNGLSGAR